jgi:thiosulfate/3-mercaptopyruvate sulfurtransferase
VSRPIPDGRPPLYGACVADGEYAKPVLVTTDWLARQKAGEIVITEVDERPGLYDEGHVPGAVSLHWRDDLQDPVERDVVGPRAFERLLGSRGIANETRVVLYGDKDNWFAAYAYWYLKLYGHENVVILDGGRQKWIDEDRPLTAEVLEPLEVEYVVKPRDDSIRAYRRQVLEALGDPRNALVDVRSPAEYAGHLIAPPGYDQEGAQRPGHIPTAVSIPWVSAMREDGTFKTASALRELYLGRGVGPEKSVIAYCRIGERSAHTWFVLHELLGYPDVRNYDGSWTEWGSLVDAPIER